MAYITGSHLAVGYEGRAILTDLNFEINQGDYLCILGENGAGKSTLMKTILGLISPIEGEILYGDGLRAKEIGYLPQQTEVQKDFPATVEEIVLSGCQGAMGLRPFYNKKECELVRINLEKLHLDGIKKRCYRELSGGQQQRVLLARALCATGRLILLDEPVAGLDPRVTSEMYETIRELNSEGITIIMISHDLGAAVKYASHILHVDKRFFFGSRDEYLKSEIGQGFLMLNGMEAN